ncbi:CHAT domain-containing protein [Thermocatellispora tengchongensis]|uniref:CHAT domain-containing protein n=1 Tax=Thermocatellispora tengchongensis TaxID=1073253 RepID=A0A840P497_9ACTN|nr:CHAT domain-containing protein [Thermocatellispora tengchongensis]MBB5133819.1 CHAT domain-containing protein [Thermocatellispora tengchongensis]
MPAGEVQRLNDDAFAAFAVFEESGLRRDLLKATRLWQTALDLARETSDRDAAWMAAYLGIAARRGHESGFGATYLDRAVRHHRLAVQLGEPFAPVDRSALLVWWGEALLDRFTAKEKARDVRLAQDAFREAMRLNPIDTEWWLRAAKGRAWADRFRYELTRQVEWLEQAVALMTRVLAGTPGDLEALRALGLLLADLSGWDRRQRGTAIGKLREAIAATPDTDPQQVILLTALGSLLTSDAVAHRDDALLDEAITCLERARRHPAADTGCLAGLSHALHVRGVRHRSEADLDQAEALIRQAIEETPPGQRVELTIHLGAVLESRDPSGLEAAGLYRSILRDTSDSPEVEPAVCGPLGEIALRQGRYDEAAAAFERGLSARWRTLGTQLRRTYREDELDHSHDLIGGAALAHALRGDPGSAALAIESGRAFALSDTISRRRPQITGDYEDYTVREMFAHLNENLQRLVQQNAAAHLVAEAREKLEEAARKIRKIPGYENFLQRPALEDLRQAARERPLLYLLPCAEAGLAVLVTAADAQTIWLPDVTEEAVAAQAARLQRACADMGADGARTIEQIGRWLGRALLAPLLAGLGDVREVVAIPCGLLGGLPLHAATLPGEGRHAIDELMISYAPNGRSLLNARRIRDQVPDDSLLSIVEPDAPGQAPLAMAWPEALSAHRWFPSGRSHRLRGAAATKESVLALVGRYSVLHAVCHATSYPADPDESALILSGGERLTLRDLREQKGLINEGRLRLRLAVLSACETAVPGHVLPDEMAGLPAGLLATGVAGVVASLWPVPDRATSILMTRFYQNWRQDGLEPAHALHAAQRWMSRATNAEILRLYPHLLRKQDIPAGGFARRVWDRAGYGHPVNWAAFVYLGV